ncbi:serine/threonine-protein kinase LMTK3 isoform X2 [Loxodonta africana]|uniref:serine/threonine-protein kinase LMTK3 isoform X2 n=1 Tax=Loxodonta africana TaxID=9785 RepID=UPI0030D2AF01
MPAPGAFILLAAVSASGCLASPAHPDGFALGRATLAPPYAVVLISCSGLLAFIFLLLTCLCCKRGDVGFKEFENPEGEDCSGEYTPPAEETSSSQSLPDVYILPLAEVSLPMPAPQPSHSDMTTPLGLSRQHLSYLQEIGSGWFGKVSGAGGGARGSLQSRTVLLFCVHPPCCHHFSSAPPLLPLPASANPSPAPLPLTRSPPPPPTSVGQRLPPHSIDHFASPPGSSLVRLSILPSVPASIGLWACESPPTCRGGRGWWDRKRDWKGGASWEVCGRVELVREMGLGKGRGVTFCIPLNQVILGEIFSDYTPAQVVVKELRASAGPLEQRKFISEAQPYRSLQHPNILQCLGLCVETLPFLLIMEFCQLGDLKRYLRAQRPPEGLSPELPPRDLRTLQRMGLEIARGLAHLHSHNYVHSDLALRNCLLTSDLTVRIGDYGLAHSNYKEDYYLTPERLWIPLRWAAPELLGELHGTFMVVDQSRESNIWSLGVTLWELFEFGAQPYRHLSDEEVLAFVVRQQHVKLARPRLKLPYADYWYDILQSCWRPPAQRPSASDLQLQLTYLLSERPPRPPPPPPPPRDGPFPWPWPPTHTAPRSGTLSSPFPLLDGFPGADPDDVLTVTESSRGLNLECLWEKARRGAGRGGGAPPWQPASAPPAPHTNPSNPFYEALSTPSVLPVISARSPSVGSEYYIRLEEHGSPPEPLFPNDWDPLDPGVSAPQPPQAPSEVPQLVSETWASPLFPAPRSFPAQASASGGFLLSGWDPEGRGAGETLAGDPAEVLGERGAAPWAEEEEEEEGSSPGEDSSSLGGGPSRRGTLPCPLCSREGACSCLPLERGDAVAGWGGHPALGCPHPPEDDSSLRAERGSLADLPLAPPASAPSEFLDPLMGAAAPQYPGRGPPPAPPPPPPPPRAPADPAASPDPPSVVASPGSGLSSPGPKPGDSGYETETPFSPEGAFPAGGAAEEEGVPRPRAPPEPPDPGAPRPPPDPGPLALLGTREKPTFMVQVSTEQLLMSLREDVTRNLLGEKGVSPQEPGPRKPGKGTGNRETAPGPTVPGSDQKAPSPNEDLSLPVNGVTVLENGGQKAPGIEETAVENGGPGSPEREDKVLANGELPPPRREKELENGELKCPEAMEKVLVNGGLTPPKSEEKVAENGGLSLPRKAERPPETGPWRAPGPWEKMAESGGPAPTIGEPAPEISLERAPESHAAVASPLKGWETAPGPIGPAPRSGAPDPGTQRRAPETGRALRAPGAGKLDPGSGGQAPGDMGTAHGGGPGSGVDAKAGWADSMRPQPPPPPEVQPRRPEPVPPRAKPEAAPEGDPGAPDSRAGGDTAPSGDGDPLKPERKGPEMPRLFLDLGPPQGNSEQIKAKLSRLSLALPPLTLTPFPGPGPRRAPWEGTDAGAAGGEAGGAGAPGPAEEDGEDEDEEDEAAGAAEPRGPGRARAAPVPVVVSSADADAARPLRGLLKSPRGADEPEDSELERKRKMVSFHGDVTVYLFDQETPTNELSVQGPPEGDTDPSTPPAPPTPPHPTTPGDGFPSNDTGFGGSFEWAEDFPLLPPPGPPLCFSRFSVSPALETPGPPSRAPDARPAGTLPQTLRPAPTSVPPSISPTLCPISLSLHLPLLHSLSLSQNVPASRGLSLRPLPFSLWDLIQLRDQHPTRRYSSDGLGSAHPLASVSPSVRIPSEASPSPARLWPRLLPGTGQGPDPTGIWGEH